jgi:Leucine-rich repeat (LRR) protein
MLLLLVGEPVASALCAVAVASALVGDIQTRHEEFRQLEADQFDVRCVTSLSEAPWASCGDVTDLYDLTATFVALGKYPDYLSNRFGRPLTDEHLLYISRFRFASWINLVARSKEADLVSRAGWQRLGRLKRLWRLSVEAESFDDDAMASIAHSPELTELLVRSSRLSAKSLDYVAKMPQINVIDLFDGEFGLRGIWELTECRNLTHVCLPGSQVGDDALAALTKIPNLTSLNLRNARVSAGGWRVLSRAKQLATLRVQHTEFDDRSATVLARLPELSVLDLSGTSISDKGVRHLRSCEKLEIVALSNTRVTDDGLTYLRYCRKLWSLAANNTRITGSAFNDPDHFDKITELELDHAKVSPTGLANIARLSNLEFLSLQKLDLGDEALTVLLNAPRLEQLVISTTADQLSTKFVEQFQDKGVSVRDLSGPEVSIP